MNLNAADILILGAGLSGLSLAQGLRTGLPQASLKILEKSRGLGGRLATRRADLVRFDHGAPWFQGEEWAKLNAFLADPEFLTPHASSPRLGIHCGKDGMTSIAKTLAQGLSLDREIRATRLIIERENWRIETDQGALYHSPTVVISAPLPQALELLQSSQIPYPNELNAVSYSKALVLLFQGDAFPGEEDFIEFKEGPFLTLCNQQRKGISPEAAWVLVMSPKFSELHFDLPETEIRNAALQELTRSFPHFTGNMPEVKKWRYSRTEVPFPQAYFQVHAKPDLYLMGDGFRAFPELKNGFECTLASSLALMEHLQNKSGAKHNRRSHP
jgi:predicted NAD/FAD-dependent oxidoreductase